MPSRDQAPGRADRAGLTLSELFCMFPDDAAAERWFEAQLWPDGPTCPDCGSARHALTRGQAAWHLLHRIRQALAAGQLTMFAGDVEVDETYVGGKEKNKRRRKPLKAGRGTVGKAAVAGAKARQSGKVRAQVVQSTDQLSLHSFVHDTVALDAQLYTDEFPAYCGITMRHVAVKHSQGEYVDGAAYTNGIESFWAMLKRGIVGVDHHVSVKHLERYVAEFAGRHNLRDLDTIEQMALVARGMPGQRLRYADLTA